MTLPYEFELWNGKKVVGTYKTFSRLYGKILVVPTIHFLKQKYSSKLAEIRVPIIYRVIYKDHRDTTIRQCLDVRKKSKRQIKILTGKAK